MLSPIVPRRPLIWHPSVEAIRALLGDDQEVYLVGGAVRDAYLHRPIHDLDLATPGDGRPLARQIADHFGGAYYSLDVERGVGRALVPWEDGQLTVDVAQFRGPDLLSDLRHRDFTINALAVRLTGDLQQVIDPLGGLHDLDAKRLRECSPDSLPDDPVRALRAVRASLSFKLLIEPVTRRRVQQVASRLPAVSAERVRDEFFQILSSPRPHVALDTLVRLGLLQQIIPEVLVMQNVAQGAPHQFDLWRHTLAVVENLDTLLRVFSPTRSDNLIGNVQFGLAAWALNSLRPQIQAHLAHVWPNNRPHHALLLLAALLHDSGKPATRTVEEGGRIRFPEHERVGEKIAEQRAVALRLSSGEVKRLTTIVRHHMRPHWLHDAAQLTPRAIFRFWRDTGPAGVDICLHSIADYLGTYSITLEQTDWTAYLEMERTLLEAYFLHPEQSVTPPPLITGQDLLDLGLQPGPLIGDLLERVTEAQVEGRLTTPQEARVYIQRLLSRQGDR